MSFLPQNRPKTDNLMAVKTEISNFRAMTLFPNICTILTRGCIYIYIYIYYIYCKSSLRMCSFKCFDKQTMTLKSFLYLIGIAAQKDESVIAIGRQFPKGCELLKEASKISPLPCRPFQTPPIPLPKNILCKVPNCLYVLSENGNQFLTSSKQNHNH